MKIVFLGTPEYAVPSLEALAAQRPAHEIVAIVTQPDRPKGRSGRPAPPPVKDAALRLGLRPGDILQPESVNEPATLAALRARAPDLFLTIAYGGILRRAARRLPRLCALNAHASLLPRHRGASPLHAAILAGDAETGVSIFRLARRLDAGPVLLQREIPIQPDDDVGSLHDKLAALSAVCFAEALRFIAAGHAAFAPQDEGQATYAAKLTRRDEWLDWARDADYLERFVRARTPWPGAWTTLAALDGSAPLRLRVLKALRPRDAAAGRGEPGTAWPASLERGPDAGAPCLAVTCGRGALQLTRVQPEGGRAMTAGEFLRGAGRAYATGGQFLTPIPESGEERGERS